MAKLTAYIFSNDARTQAAFYTQALGGQILNVVTNGDVPGTKPELKDKVLNMSFVAAGVQFMISDAEEQVNRGNGLDLALEFATEAEAREAFEKLSSGGKVNQPLIWGFWGAWFSEFEDKFGVRWMITTEPKAQQ